MTLEKKEYKLKYVVRTLLLIFYDNISVIKW